MKTLAAKRPGSQLLLGAWFAIGPSLGVVGAVSGSLRNAFLVLVPLIAVGLALSVPRGRVASWGMIDATPAIFAVCSLLLAVLPSPAPTASGLDLRLLAVTLIPAIGSYYAIRLTTTSRSDSRYLGRALIGGGAVVLGYAFILVAVPSAPLPKAGQTLVKLSGSADGLATTFGNPAASGTFAAVLFLFALSRAVSTHVPAVRIRFGLLAAASALVTALSLQRGAYVALLAGLVVVAWSQMRIRKGILLAALSVGLVVATPLGSQIPVSQGVIQRLENQTTIQERVTMNEYSLATMWKYPLTGTGFSSFDTAKGTVSLALSGPFSPTYYTKGFAKMASHNTFLTVGSEQGVATLLLMLLALGLPTLRSIQLLRRSAGSDNWVGVASSASVVAIVAAASTFELRYFPWLWSLPWALAALSMSATQAQSRVATASASRSVAERPRRSVVPQ